jgi:hypothetical protein
LILIELINGRKRFKEIWFFKSTFGARETIMNFSIIVRSSILLFVFGCLAIMFSGSAKAQKHKSDRLILAPIEQGMGKKSLQAVNPWLDAIRERHSLLSRKDRTLYAPLHDLSDFINLMNCEMAALQSFSNCVVETGNMDCCAELSAIAVEMCRATSGAALPSDFNDFCRDAPGPGGGGGFGPDSEGDGSDCEEHEYLVDVEVTINMNGNYVDCMCTGTFEGTEDEYGNCVTIMTDGECDCEGISGGVEVRNGTITIWP